jgi:hypothetical protein
MRQLLLDEAEITEDSATLNQEYLYLQYKQIMFQKKKKKNINKSNLPYYKVHVALL